MLSQQYTWGTRRQRLDDEIEAVRLSALILLVAALDLHRLKLALELRLSRRIGLQLRGIHLLVLVQPQHEDLLFLSGSSSFE